MKRTTRILLVLLTLCMIVPLAAACTTGDDPVDTTDNVADTTDGGNNDTAPVTTVSEYDVSDDLDKYNLNYKDDRVNVLNWKAEEPEFYIETTDGTKVNDAIWTRNNHIETRLGVELDFTEIEGNNANKKQFISRVETEAKSGYDNGHSFDIIATYSRTAGSLSILGYYKDLNSIEESYFNFDKPWWPEKLIDTITIGESLYFVSGDMSTNTIHFMYTIFFNKDLVKQYTDITDDFYDLVNNGNWTIKRLIKYAEGRYEDNPSAGVQGHGAAYGNSDLEDTYGFCTIYYGVDAFYTGSGLKLVVQDDEKTLKLSEDYLSEKTIKLIDILNPFLSGPDCVTVTGGSTAFSQPFTNGRALFCQNRAYYAKRALATAEFKYGILPTPKYDAKQDDYYSIVGNPFTLYGISSWTKAERLSEMTAILECWGSEGFRGTTPALFEETMKARYAEAEEDADMWNIIRRTSCFDLGRLYGNDVLGYYISEEPSKIACTGGNWQRTGTVAVGVIEKKLADVVAKYEEIQG